MEIFVFCWLKMFFNIYWKYLFLRDFFGEKLKVKNGFWINGNVYFDWIFGSVMLCKVSIDLSRS